MSDTSDFIRTLAADLGANKVEVGPRLPDGSGFAVMSLPLPSDHWIYTESGEPPVPFRTGTDAEIVIGGKVLTRTEFAACIREAGKYAVRAATMSGKDMDFDPDALLQNLVVGVMGYWTPDGTSNL